MEKTHSQNSRTGREWKISIPKVREREGNEKIGSGIKEIHSQTLGTGREWKKDIPEIQEREGNDKIHSQSSGTGIRGLHSWEWPGTEIPAHPWPKYFHGSSEWKKKIFWAGALYVDSSLGWNKLGPVNAFTIDFGKMPLRTFLGWTLNLNKASNYVNFLSLYFFPFREAGTHGIGWFVLTFVQ